MDFPEHLRLETKSYTGLFQHEIRLAPELFQLVNDLTLSNEIPEKKKYDLYVAMGYFIAPNDLFSEEIFGPIGYVDDLSLVLHVLNLIKSEVGIEPIYDKWDRDFVELEGLFNDSLPALCQHYPEYSKKLKRIVK